MAKEATRRRCSHPRIVPPTGELSATSVSPGRRFAVHQCPPGGGHWASADGDQRLVGPDLFWSIGRLDGVVTAVGAVAPATTHETVLRRDAALGQDGQACRASAETSRNSFAVAPLAA